MVPTNFPIYVPENKTAQYVMIAISLTLIILFWTMIFYVYRTTPGANATVTLYEVCTPGKCAMNVKTGEKRCLTDASASIVFKGGYEICSSPYVCDNKKMPYALLSDGSVDMRGNCEPGTICRCTDKISCASYITTTFKTINGTQFLTGTGSQRYSLQQVPITNQNTIGWEGPVIKNVNTELCYVSQGNLFRISPTTRECSVVDQNNPDIDDVRACVNSNPCVNGVMAVITNTQTSTNVSLAQIKQAVLGCVPGTPCEDPNQWPIYDIAFGRAICV